MRTSLAIVFLFVQCLPMTAQVTSGAVLGAVRDPSDRPVQSALVRLVDRLHAQERSASTDHTGYFRFSSLPPSLYDISVTASGFRTATAQVRVSVDSGARVDFVLRLAGVQEAIEVSARVRSVQTDSSDLGSVLDEAAIRALPLNRRDFLQLALLTAGVLPPVEGSELATRGAFAMHASGAREEFNNFLLDGVDNNDQTGNRYVLQPSADAIQEFKIATNNYAAEYGRNAGAQVNVVTRRGSAQWHGVAYEYLRNRVLDARNFFDGSEKSKYIRNQFGAGLGGQLVRDKLFFFGSFDGLRSRIGSSSLASVPDGAQRAGDLSGLAHPVLDIFSGAPFPGNRIPASRISPLAQKVLNLFPAPNRPGLSGNYLGQPVSTESVSQFTGRLDYHIGRSDQITLRYSYGASELFEAYTEQASQVPGFGDYPNDHGHNGMVQYQHVFSGQVFNSLLLGVNRPTRSILQQNYRTNANELWGVNYLPAQARDFGFPSLTVAGYSSVGDAGSLPIIRSALTSQVGDALSAVRGSHNLKIGGEVRNMRNNGVVDVMTRGSLSFSGAISGVGIGDLLLGFPSFGVQSQADNMQTQRTTSYNGYIQDSWNVLPRLTLNLGLRYEFNTPATDPTNRMTVFDTSRADLVQVGSGGVSRSGMRADFTNLAPRAGFALTLGSQTVLRGGYGIFYDCGALMVNSAAYFNPPFFTVHVYFPTAASLLTLNNPFPRNGGMAPPAALSTFSPDFQNAYLQHWNLNLQREFTGIGTLSAAYAGSKGTKLVRSRDINQPPPGEGAVGARAAYPKFSNILQAESGADSEYQALEITFRRALTRNTAAVAIYTFSKSMDDTSAFLSTFSDKNFPQDSRNFRAEHALSSFDLPQRASIAIVQRMPRRNRVTRNVDISGIVVAQSGQPFTPMLQFDNSNTGNTGGSFGSDRPNLLHNPTLPDPTPERWFDPSAFAVAPKYTFGNAGRNIVRGPGLFTVDLSLSRRFVVAERSSIDFQAQAFNLLNRTNFGLPEHYADNPATFGRIFSAKSPRHIQFALRLNF